MGTETTLVLTRKFDAPRSVVFAAWIDEKQFAKWWGPHNSTLAHCRLDPRPGGLIHFCHQFDEGDDVWVRGEYREVVEPELLVFVAGFSNDKGEAVERPGFALETEIAVSFIEADGGTEVRIRHSGLIEDRGESLGWSEQLDRLATLLHDV